MDNKEEFIAREALGTDMGTILEVLRSKALLIAICTASGLVLAFLYTLFYPSALLCPNRHSD